jgi:hypothetical protein
MILFTAALGILVSGCAFAGKDVNLMLVSPTQPVSGMLTGLEVAVNATDARKGEPGVIGATGWSLGDVRTKDSVAKWFKKTLEAELEKSGAHFAESAKTKVTCTINDMDASFGFMSLINSKLAVGVTVGRNGKENALGEFILEHSPFAFFDSQSAYEEAIAETLKLWMGRHAPKIISALAAIKSMPIEPTVDPEDRIPTKPPVEPEIVPASPGLTITSPATGTKSDKPTVVVSGRAENAVGGVVRIRVNGREKGSIHLRTAHEPFSVPVPLSAGKNKVEAVLTLNTGKKITRNLEAVYIPPPLDGCLAVTVGVSSFKNLGKSPNSEAAAGETQRALLAGAAKGSNSRITGLNPKASVRNVLTTLKQSLGNAKAEQNLIIFYFGTLIESGDELALAVQDTQKDNPASAVLFSDIILAVERHFQGKSVLIIAQGKAGESLRALPQPELLETALSVILFSPSKNSEKAVPAGLKGAADANRDGYVTVSEISSYLGRNGTAVTYGDPSTSARISRTEISRK